MKNVPPFSTECHIESKDIDKCTSIKSLVLKKIFGDNKYRLIFHKRPDLLVRAFAKVHEVFRILFWDT